MNYRYERDGWDDPGESGGRYRPDGRPSAPARARPEAGCDPAAGRGRMAGGWRSGGGRWPCGHAGMAWVTRRRSAVLARRDRAVRVLRHNPGRVLAVSGTQTADSRADRPLSCHDLPDV